MSGVLLTLARLCPHRRAHAFIRKAMNTERPIDLRYIDEPNPLDGPVTRPPRRMVWMRAKGEIRP